MTRPTIPNATRWGVGLAAATALISGVSVFINGFAVKQLPDAAVYTTLKNGVAAAVLLGIALVVVRGSEIRALDRRAWGGMVAVAVIGGSIPFILFFSGLAAASAPTAAFIHKTLFIWVTLFAVPVLGERLGWYPIAGLAALLVAQAMVTPPAGIVWGAGETMIAAATLMWAVEVILVKRLLRTIPSPILAAARLGLGLVVLVAYLGVSGRLGIVASLSPERWAWALLTGAFLAGYVATWYAALRRAPAHVVASVLVLGAPITAVLQSVASGTVPAVPVLAGQVLIVVGVLVLVSHTLRARRPRPAAAVA